jgi:hypothetical protein
LRNHNSHCTLVACKFFAENEIVPLPIPPHTSHRLQLFDVFPMVERNGISQGEWLADQSKGFGERNILLFGWNLQ